MKGEATSKIISLWLASSSGDPLMTPRSCSRWRRSRFPLMSSRFCTRSSSFNTTAIWIVGSRRGMNVLRHWLTVGAHSGSDTFDVAAALADVPRLLVDFTLFAAFAGVAQSTLKMSWHTHCCSSDNRWGARDRGVKWGTADVACTHNRGSWAEPRHRQTKFPVSYGDHWIGPDSGKNN